MSTAAARRLDPDTSIAAAAAVPANDLELLVRRTLAMHPNGLTTQEITDITGVKLVSVSPRMKPLEGRNLVLRTAERRNGSTVWRPVFIDAAECSHPDELLVYKSEWPGFFDKPSLHTCASCGTSIMREKPSVGGARVCVMAANDGGGARG